MPIHTLVWGLMICLWCQVREVSCSPLVPILLYQIWMQIYISNNEQCGGLCQWDSTFSSRKLNLKAFKPFVQGYRRNVSGSKVWNTRMQDTTLISQLICEKIDLCVEINSFGFFLLQNIFFPFRSNSFNWYRVKRGKPMHFHQKDRWLPKLTSFCPESLGLELM